MMGNETDSPENIEDKKFFLQFVQKLGWKGAIGLGLCAISAPNLLNGGRQGTPFTIDVGSGNLTERSVEMSENHEQASFLLRMEQLESGLLNQQAQQFYGAAVNFQNQKDHFCAGKSLRSCLLSFQRTRADEILALGLSATGNRNNNARVGQLLFDIKAIELAIARQTEPDVATQAFIDSSVKHPHITEAPVATFLEAFKDHQNRKVLQDQLNQEMIQAEYAKNQLDDCRANGGRECL